ncbi:hypothetical protein ALQ39_03823 [Pseudomonas amygdali pv. eriobotryae]|uniref:Uncharacterized protein n=1 Tax=Pseudomonas amygdali pv. eriobotryae TaxID=129137 RepID=A0A3M3WXK0_PSEA0|nr:hypothetical protein ALQ39_03823 [Pseudomonas amygdali pv. eriobotryae]
MNVRRTLFDRALQNQVDQTNDRRFGGQILEVLDVFQRAALLIQVLDQGAHCRAALSVITLNKGFDFIARPDGQPHRHFAGISDGLERVQRTGVGAEHLQPLIAPAYGHDLIVAHEALGQRRQGVEQRRHSVSK